MNYRFLTTFFLALVTFAFLAGPSVALAANHTITASASAGGTIFPFGNVSVADGANKTFFLTPNSGYVIDTLTVDGSSVSVASSYTFTNVTTNHTIAVAFALSPVPSITITTQSPLPDAMVGTVYSTTLAGISSDPLDVLTWSISSGSLPAGLSLDGATGALTGTPTADGMASFMVQAVGANPQSAPALQGYFLTVNPVPTHTIAASAGANGSMSPSGAVAVNEGADQAFTISAVNGYHIADVLVDGASVGAVGSHTFTNVIADHTISATFAANQTSGGGGGGGYALPPQGRSTAPTPVVTPPVTPPVVVVPPVVVAPVAETPVVVIPEVLTSTLALGARGGDVIALQNRLIAEGLLHTSATGYFGPFTESAVKAYQVKYGIPALGIVGPLTRAEFLKPVGHDAPVNTALVVNTSAATPAVEETVAAEGAT